MRNWNYRNVISTSKVILRTILALAGLMSTSAMSTSAQTLVTLHDFCPFPNGESLQAAPTLGSDGNLYCTSYGRDPNLAGSGAAVDYGAVFRVDAQGNITTLHTFIGSDGANPEHSVVEGPDGAFYGTTRYGGDPKKSATDGPGTIFKITKNGQFSTIHVFAGTEGPGPTSLVFGKDGALYGSTYESIFRIQTDGTITLLHSFTDGDCENIVFGQDGKLYGTTASSGGTNNTGTVFRCSIAGDYQTLYSFPADDTSSHILMQTSTSDFYITSCPFVNGESLYPFGRVLRLDQSGNVTTIHEFNSSDGEDPNGLAEGPDGSLFGSTYEGGPSANGTIFKISPDGTFQTLYTFSGSAGAKPLGGLQLASDGNFYGSTTTGTENFGTIFRMTPAGSISTLASLHGSEGSNPHSGLVQTSDGSFYGTTYFGGYADLGTVFKLRPDGTFSTLHSFDGADGIAPESPPIIANNGNLYGNANQGVYAIGSNDQISQIYTFTDGGFTTGSLIQGSDGALYGTTTCDGANGAGTVFKLTTDGAMSSLCSFSGIGGPGQLMQADNGLLYGTFNGGAMTGSIYSIGLNAGGIKTLFTFPGGSDLSEPNSGLTEGSDGNLYGTAQNGGEPNNYEYGYGGIYRISKSGDIAVLHAFNNTDSADPVSELTQGRDGNFYGTTYGWSDNGSVFRISPNGDFKTLFFFNSSTGTQPIGTVIQGADGNLYGTTSRGGVYGCGTVFELKLPLTQTYSTGLHFFSLPYDYPTTDLDTLFGYTGVRLAVWSPSTYSYAVTPTSPADHVRLGVGYWGRFPQSVTTSSIGTQADTSKDFTINLTAGWNSVGDPFLTPVATTDLKFGSSQETFAQATSGGQPLIGSTVWGYDPGANSGNGGYIGAGSIVPGQGYWIWAAQDTTMIVPHP